ncbi:efflux RND transporter permease subunit [Bacillus sp. RG28]|uniref:Efflux RND transporter permease subunit n=1 Tax=Gottfriedia endophytica TaxID=2820819 RepID=A0A940SLZ9_9BACI|nr:efflux RND transporter permease subunit [Gottfriedia endophytica]MBP0726843.1 efflux RND transporter permease subunit [Gottfriedia endophytica]
MKKLVEGTMQRAILMIVCVVIILAWGAMSAFQMQRDYLPGINNTTLTVSMRLPMYQANQVKQNITDSLVSAVRTTDGLQDIETSSYDGGVFMSLYFPMNTDMKQAEADVNKALDNADLPSTITSKPLVTRITTSSFPILTYTLTSDKLDDNTLRSTAQQQIVKQLNSVPGVANVSVFGGAKDGYVLTVRMKDLVKNKLTLDDLNKALANSVPSLPEGNIQQGHLSIPVSFDGWTLTPQQMKDVKIKNADGNPVPLSAFASMTHALNDASTVSRTDGKTSIQLNIIKSPSANITDVAKNVKDRINGLQLVKNGSVKLTPQLDRAKELNDSLNGLMREGLLGCLFSMVCVFFFFRNVRSTLLIAISLPISLLATTAILKPMGITLNILTVSGLIVAMGRIVDDSIVILDNMYRRREESKDKSLLSVLGAAVNEMIPAILGSTLTTIAVFLPIAFVGGYVSASYSGFAWSVVIALIISFFVAMLVIPTLAFLGWKGAPSKQKALSLEPAMKPVLKSALKHRKLVVIISVLLFAVAAGFGSLLPVSLLPSAKSGQIAVKLELPQGSTLAQVDSEVQKVENNLKNNSKVKSYTSTFGSNNTPQSDDVFDQGGGYIQKSNVANLSVVLKNDKDADSVITELGKQLPSLSKNVAYTVTSQNISGDDSQMKLIFAGSDQATLDKTAAEVRTKLAKIDGLSVDGKVDLTNGLPKYKITFNQNAIAEKGVQLSDIMKVINRYMGQTKDATLVVDHKNFPVDVYPDQISSGSPMPVQIKVTPNDVIQSLENETFQGKGNQPVKLSQLVTITKDQAPSTINERNGLPYSVVTAQITSNDISKVSNKVDQELQKLNLPSGVTYSMGGISQQVQEMIVDMSVAVAFSILLVLLITSTLFKGWKAPLSVLLSIPLALSGVVIALVIFGGEWNLAALIGVLMLTGIVVTNGIVLIDKIERNRRNGMELEEAVISGSLSRVRPILITAATTILTLLPLAFSHQGDTVISQTLGIVVIGGMITSTCNSFLVIPIIYQWLNKKDRKKVIVSNNETTI